MKSFSIGIASFTLSAALNFGVLLGADKVLYVSQVVHEQRYSKILKSRPQESSIINFNYVDTPKEVHKPIAPIKSSKISDKDAVAADLYKHKPKDGNTPLVANRGLADEITQKQNAAASPLSLAKPAKQAKIPGEIEQKKKEQTPVEKMTENGEALKKKATLSEPEQKESSQSQEFQKPQKASEASVKVDGSRGREKISTNQTSSKPSAGASMYGVTSFEATGSGMGQYMKGLKEKIWLAWFPYLAFRHPMDFKTADAVLSMTLNASGDLKDVHVVNFEGSETFASFCVESVRRVKNFGKVPPEILALMGRDEFELKFAFHFK